MVIEGKSTLEAAA